MTSKGKIKNKGGSVTAKQKASATKAVKVTGFSEQSNTAESRMV